MSDKNQNLVKTFSNSSNKFTKESHSLCKSVISSMKHWLQNNLVRNPKKSRILYVQHTTKWIWDRSIYSIIKPTFDIILFQDFWRFTEICKKFAAFARKIVFVIVSEQFCYRNNNKNNFVSKCCKFLANLCKSSEIVEECHVKWWLKYRYHRSVSWRLSCTDNLERHSGKY